MIAEFEGNTTELVTPPTEKTTTSSPDLKIVHRLGEIPLVADSLVTFE